MLLHANGFGYVERGNFIYVYTLEDLQKLEKESASASGRSSSFNYLSAVDAASFAQAFAQQRLGHQDQREDRIFPRQERCPDRRRGLRRRIDHHGLRLPEQVEQIEKLVKTSTPPRTGAGRSHDPSGPAHREQRLRRRLRRHRQPRLRIVPWRRRPLRIPDAMLVNNPPSSSTVRPAIPRRRRHEQPAQRRPGIASTAGNVAGPGTMKVGLYSNDVGVFIKMLDEVTDTTILSNPKILALNRQPPAC